MKVLVIGGTYFLGRVFTILTREKYDLTLVNRGRYSMKDFNVKEIHFDRHDPNAWKKVHGKYDAIVDFCAYDEGDIQTVLDNIDASISKYIFISTVDVYQRQVNHIKDETTSLETNRYGGETGAYIYGKIQLEKELESECTKKGIDYVSLRLGNLYGPFNYAPRESEFLKRIYFNEPLYHLSDAKAKFQFVYVKDAALAISKVIEQNTKEHAYNILDDEVIDYNDLNFVFSTLTPCNVETCTVEEANKKEYPLVYPIYLEGQELYSGKRFREEFEFHYTPLENGMAATYKALLPILETLK